MSGVVIPRLRAALPRRPERHMVRWTEAREVKRNEEQQLNATWGSTKPLEEKPVATTIEGVTTFDEGIAAFDPTEQAQIAACQRARRDALEQRDRALDLSTRAYATHLDDEAYDLEVDAIKAAYIAALDAADALLPEGGSR